MLPKACWSQFVALAALFAGWLSQAKDASYTRIARGPWSGALTTNSAEIRAKLYYSGSTARLWLSRYSDLSEPVVSAPVVSRFNIAGNVVAFRLQNLLPDTAYYYALEVQGELERVKAGRFHTLPQGRASFEFAFASCGRSGSTNASYDCIRRHSPLFFICPGDFHYEDVYSSWVDRFHWAYDRALASPVQARLYWEVPLVYMWDDHDFCGNNSDGRGYGKAAVKRAYRDYFPHYPLMDETAGGPIAQSFVVGRVKFIVTDLRSQRDPAAAVDGPTKSMMGAAQRAWWQRELVEANGRYPLIFWVSSVPWIGTSDVNHYWPAGTNTFGYIHHQRLDYAFTNARPLRGPVVDSWAAYAHERALLAGFVKTNKIRGLVILHGDMHALAADDGSHSDYAPGGGAPIPVMAAAPLDQEGSLKGGPYSQGVYKPKKGEGCFGLVTVTDSGNHITARFSGRNSADVEQITLTVTVPAL